MGRDTLSRVLLGVVLGLGASCAGAGPPLADDAAPEAFGCLVRPPPEWLPVDVLDPPECAEDDVAGCLDIEAAIRLRRQLLELRTWADIAWERCGENASVH